MSFVAVQKVSAYESIVEQVERAIDSGELKAGDRLPGERQLMADFSVSRAVVREALRVLQATGIIESRPGDPRGPLVTAYSSKQLEKSMSRLAALDTVSRVELLEFRMVLEGHACLLAAEKRTDDDLARMDAAVLGIKAVVETGEGSFGDEVNRFYEAIRKAAGNQLIEVCGRAVGGIMSALTDRRLLTEVDRRARIERSVHDSQVLIDAIRRQQPREAERISVQNIFRYHRDDLTADEKTALETLVGALPED